MGKTRDRLSDSAELLRELRRDPQHLPELILLDTQRRLAPGALRWAQRAAANRPESARTARRQARTAARVDGAIAGTPFLIALVPAYVASLREQARLALRYAALSDRDPAARTTVAEILVLRGVHSDLETSLRELNAADAGRKVETQPGLKNKLISVYRLVLKVLVFAAFTDPPSGPPKSTARKAITFTVACGIWIFTSLVPISFMALMAWSCESATRRIAQDTSAAWLPDLPPPAPERLSRKVGRFVIIGLGTAVPLGLVMLAVVDPGSVPIATASIAGLTLALTLTALVARDSGLAED
jgi:hypothetical protein